jgi:hypothetical protein
MSNPSQDRLPLTRCPDIALVLNTPKGLYLSLYCTTATPTVPILARMILTLKPYGPFRKRHRRHRPHPSRHHHRHLPRPRPRHRRECDSYRADLAVPLHLVSQPTATSHQEPPSLHRHPACGPRVPPLSDLAWDPEKKLTTHVSPPATGPPPTPRPADNAPPKPSSSASAACSTTRAIRTSAGRGTPRDS